MIDRMDDWGDVGVYPTVPALLAAGVAKYGSHDYVVTATERITFAEAEQRSAALAKRFIAAGAGKGTRIGVLLPNGPGFAVAFLAAARIGALAILISTTYRPGEIRRALKLADVQILIAPQQLFNRDYEDDLQQAVTGLSAAGPGPLHLPEMPYLRQIWLTGPSDKPWAQVAETDDVPASITDELLAAIEAEVHPSDPMVVIWTSGSSADPKGVVHTHGVGVRKVCPTVGSGLFASYEGYPRDFTILPFFWVAGPQSMLGALYTGNTIVTQPRNDWTEALELIERERCTSLSGWMSAVEQLSTHPDYEKRDLSSILPPPDFPWLTPSSKGDPLNMGMTETFGPQHNRRIFDYKVIDRETGEVLPDGEVGEFCVRGHGLMHAMYKKEREEVLDADGYYHTGDRGYIENDRIYLKGRYSETIKVGGANVAPLEVEQVFLTLAGVRQAFVFGLPDPARGQEVAAVVVPNDGQQLTAEGLRAELLKQLSAYKVPTRIDVVSVDEVPWLPTGKPDKRAMIAARTPSVEVDRSGVS